MNIWIVTDTKYPNNDAPSVRNHLMAKALIYSGHSVCVFSRGVGANKGIYDTVPFISLRGNSERKIGLIINYYFHFPEIFIRKIKEERPDAIIVYNIPTVMLLKLIFLQNKYHFVLFHDCVEWYSIEQFEKINFSQAKLYYQRNLWMKHILPGQVKVIAISQYIKKYFEGKNTNCVYFPSVCDCESAQLKKRIDRDKIIIAYAGLPGRKDHFSEIINAINMLSVNQKKMIELHIIGATYEQIAANAEVGNEIMGRVKAYIKCLPRMTHDKVMEYFQKVSFTILVRPENVRYSKAGFPTKVPESLVTGTPVICNYTSDLREFLTDGYDSVIVKECSKEAVYDALSRVLNMSYEERMKMCKQARITAEVRFDYRIYAGMLSQFCKEDKNRN